LRLPFFGFGRFCIFGGARVLASQTRYFETQRRQLVSSLAPPGLFHFPCFRAGVAALLVLVAMGAVGSIEGGEAPPTNQWVIPFYESESSSAIGTDGTIYL